MTKADYSYTIDWDEGFIQIIDLDKGNMSVTNDIEAVIDEIAEEQGIDPIGFDVVYRDSESNWDGWDTIMNRFIHLSASTMEEAKEMYKVKFA